jgi:hypothetical protein
VGDDRRFRGNQKLPHNERRVNRVVFTMQGPGVVVWTFAPDVFSSVASERRNRIFVVAFIGEKREFFLYIFLTMHLRIILVGNQIEAQFLL